MIWNSVSSPGWHGTLNSPASSSQLLETQMSATGLGEVLLYYFRSVYNSAPQNFSLDDSESILSVGSVSLSLLLTPIFVLYVLIQIMSITHRHTSYMS